MPAPNASRCRRLAATARATAAPVALGAAAVLAFFAPLLSSATALANRDIAFFHLPLRVDFARLVALGPPVWNPWLNGGQPVLSNPNYAAFYPPSWLAVAVAPAYALNLLALLHAALAFAGAWVLARRLGCGRGAAAFAAVGYAGAGGFVALLHAFNLFIGMAWFPWVLAAGERALQRPAGGRDWWRPAAGCAVAFALQILSGEPVAAMVTGLALVALAASAARRPAIALRLVVPVVLAGLLAAIQILPTLDHLSQSPRARALDAELAGTWSAPPARLAELVFPRLWGDPARDSERLYFGWRLHDKHFPYLVSIYPGLLITALGLTALVGRPVPRRWAWVGAAGAGIFLGLGRHNPLYPFLQQHLPLLGMVRYPEKFLLLAVGVLPFAAALGWQRLSDADRRGESAACDLPLALCLAIAAAAAALALGAHLAPEVAAGYVRAGSGLPPSPETAAAGVRFLTGEAWWTAALATASAGVLALLRRRRLPPAVAAAIAVALVGGDLWRTGHGLVTRAPAAEYQNPPPAARELLHSGGGTRVFSDELVLPQDELVVVRSSEPELDRLRNRLARLDPYSGNLWGIGYALNRDYDLMLTGWAQHALEVLREDWREASRVARLLGAWNVGTVVARTPTPAMLAQLTRGEDAAPAVFFANPHALPRFRFVPAVTFHPTAAAALAAARTGGYDFARADHWVGGGAAAAGEPARPARLLAVDERGGLVAIRYRAPEGGFLVAATTFDRGWRAAVDGRASATYATAIGQLGVVVPAGEHRLDLRYRTPRLGAGAALSAAGLLGVALLLAGARRERRPAA